MTTCLVKATLLIKPVMLWIAAGCRPSSGSSINIILGRFFSGCNNKDINAIVRKRPSGAVWAEKILSDCFSDHLSAMLLPDGSKIKS